MKRSVKIFAVFVIMLFAVPKVFSQGNTQKIDSLQLKTMQEQTSVEGNETNAKGNANGQANNNSGPQAVKQVKGRRPDMSRAKGARPPMIVRPSGSGIPKGVGKPGGVGRKGGR